MRSGKLLLSKPCRACYEVRGEAEDRDRGGSFAHLCYTSDHCSMTMLISGTAGDPDARLSLDEQGITGEGRRHWNPSPAVLAEHALSRGEGSLSDQGALVFATGKYTGRSPKDKFIVREPSCEAEIDWGEVNQPFTPEAFDALHQRVLTHLRGREVWVQDA